MRVAISWVRDEADIIAETVSHIAAQVDLVIVMDHGSTDGTRELLGSLSGPLPLLVLDDGEPQFRQADAMNHLAALATQNFGADWIVPFDADEFWCLPDDLPDAEVAQFDVFDHIVVAGVDGMPYRKAESLSKKVMFRPGRTRKLAMGNHRIYGPGTIAAADGVVHHFSIRSVEQFERKVLRGVTTYHPGDYGAHWRRMAAQIDEEGAEAVFQGFTALDPSGLVYDPVSRG